MRIPRPHYLLALLGAGAVLAVTRPGWIDPEQALAPYSFQEPGEAPLLLLRCAALFLALYAARESWSRGVLLIVLFAASLAARGVLLPFVGVAAFVIGRAPEVPTRIALVAEGVLAMALVLAVLPRLAHVAPTPDPRDPPQMVAYFQGRKNPYEARWWALTWSRLEAPNAGEGHLALARIDWELGRRPQARKVLEKILAHPTSDAARANADALRAEWGSESPE